MEILQFIDFATTENIGLAISLWMPSGFNYRESVRKVVLQERWEVVMFARMMEVLFI
jgi:hypothetical protein